MKIKLAIAEDNEFLIKSLLEKLSIYPDKFNILFTARNGQEIVNYLNVNIKPDVLLMDIEMPVMDGIKATELISEKYP